MRTTHSTLVALCLCLLAFLSVIQAQMECGPAKGSCLNGLCCSKDGYCGDTLAHCVSDNCQQGFGRCNEGPSPTVTSSGPTVTEAPPVPTTDIALPSPPAATSTFTPSPVTSDIPSPSPTTEASSSSSSSVAPSASATKATYQFQPTGRPSGASASRQDSSSVHSRIALVVVILATLLWI